MTFWKGQNKGKRKKTCGLPGTRGQGKGTNHKEA